MLREIEGGEFDNRAYLSFNSLNSLKRISLKSAGNDEEWPSVGFTFQFWIPSLLEASEDVDPLIRLGAIRALGRMAVFTSKLTERSEIGPRFFRAVTDSDPKVRETAVFDLYLFKSSHCAALLPALRTALKDPDVVVRRRAVSGLGIVAEQYDDLRHQAAVELAKVLAGQDDAEVRKAAAWSLGYLERNQMTSNMAPDFVMALVNALSDRNVEIRRYVASILGEAHTAQAGQPRSIWANRKALIVPALLAAKIDPDDGVRLEVALGLFQFGKRDDWTRSMLEKATTDSDKSRRRQAAQSLQEWDKEEEELGLGIDGK